VKAARAGQHARYIVLDTEVPLATLLGYAEWLDELAEGSAHLSMWLARYVPVSRGRLTARGPGSRRAMRRDQASRLRPPDSGMTTTASARGGGPFVPGCRASSAFARSCIVR
jgi:hypothetical protein